MNTDDLIKQFLASGGKITQCPAGAMTDTSESILIEGMRANIDGDAKRETAFRERMEQVQARRAAQKRFEREEYP